MLIPWLRIPSKLCVPPVVAIWSYANSHLWEIVRAKFVRKSIQNCWCVQTDDSLSPLFRGNRQKHPSLSLCFCTLDLNGYAKWVFGFKPFKPVCWPFKWKTIGIFKRSIKNALIWYKWRWVKNFSKYFKLNFKISKNRIFNYNKFV